MLEIQLAKGSKELQHKPLVVWKGLGWSSPLVLASSWKLLLELLLTRERELTLQSPSNNLVDLLGLLQGLPLLLLSSKSFFSFSLVLGGVLGESEREIRERG